MTRKLINSPEAIIPELIEGFVAAWPDLLAVEGPTGRALVARDGPRDGKVGIVIGGGSGHEPAFAGYVGRGLADAAAIGNVFASPSPAQIVDAARAADGGAGVVMLFGNYTGDVMNFDMAREQMEAEGTPCRCVAVTDDVASAPAERTNERRGIAGDFFVFKIAGAAADAGRDLEGVVAAAQAANRATRSMGVALSACSMPQTAVPNFEVPEGQMEVGMGLHGEPGVARLPLEPADAVADRLLEPILGELDMTDGHPVAALLNGLGATSQLELLILWRRVAARLADAGAEVRHRWVGEYATSLEMAGASLTVMALDDDLLRLLEHPCRTPALTVGMSAAAAAPRAPRRVRAAATPAPSAGPGPELIAEGVVTPTLLRAMIAAAADRMRQERDALSKLDGAIGDGDHGITMEMGWNAAEEAVRALPEESPPERICRTAADALLNAVGASSGPLWASALTGAATAVADRRNLDAAALGAWIVGLRDGMRARGGAMRGEKTMMDAWDPAAEAAQAVAANGVDAAAVIRAAALAAARGAEATRDMLAARGRAAKLGERARGHVDPGAASTAAILDAFAQAVESGTA